MMVDSKRTNDLKILQELKVGLLLHLKTVVSHLKHYKNKQHGLKWLQLSELGNKYTTESA